MRAVEREGRHDGVKELAVGRLHLVGAAHNAGRRSQGRAAGVFERPAGVEHRLFAHHAGAAHFLHPTETVGDVPIARAQLNRFPPFIFDANVICPDEVVLHRRGLFFQEAGFDGDADAAGDFAVHCAFLPYLILNASDGDAGTDGWADDLPKIETTGPAVQHPAAAAERKARQRCFGVAAALVLAAGAATAQDQPAPPPASPAAAPRAAYVVTFDDAGLDGDLASLLRRASNLAALAEQPPETALGLERRVAADKARLETAMRSQGYYAATVEIVADLAATPTTLRVSASPGPRYVFGATRVDLALDPADAALAAAATRNAALPVGEPAQAAKVLTAQDELINSLRAAGYPFAAVDRQVVVDHDRKTMDVAFAVRPGPAARFGLTTLAGDSGVADDLIMGRIPWRTGERYRPMLLDKARKDIAALGAFDGVAAIPDLSQEAAGVVPVTLRAEPRLRRFIGASALYSSEDGFGLRAWWGHRNLFGRAEKLRVDLATARLGTSTVKAGGLGKTDFNLGAMLEAPDFLARGQSLQVYFRAISENPAAYTRRGQVAGVGLERRLSEGLTARLLVEQDASYVETNTRDYRVGLLGLTGALAWDRSDNPLDPTRGFRVTAELGTWTPFAGSGAGSFASAAVEGRVYHDFSGDGGAVLAGRLGLATLLAQKLADVPPHRRLYAGGGASVRGYAAQMAGPRDAAGDPTGGLTRIDAGTEVRVKVADSIGVVPFVDAAMVGDAALGGFDDGLRVGAGLGVRYYTDFGPLRADLAFPFGRERNDSLMQLYVSFGQAF